LYGEKNNGFINAWDMLWITKHNVENAFILSKSISNVLMALYSMYNSPHEGERNEITWVVSFPNLTIFSDVFVEG
jgi:hypothetical protein